jgi:dihydroneopterin aldolase
MPQTIRITGIRAEGRHGARAGERDEPQPFVIDLELEVDARDDDLDTTADYRPVVETVRALVTEGSFHIIETIAERTAEAVVAIDGVRRCRATVHKPWAAERLQASDVSAEAERPA